MADTKVSALTEVSVPDLSDDLYLVDNTGPTSYKVGMDRVLGLLPSICDGRLTAVTNTPVPTTESNGATTLYFTPYVGANVALYDGTRWRLYVFSEISLALGTLTASLPYDVFLYDNAGTLTLELLAWTNGTTRATALARQDGVWCKSGAPTRRYVGTIYTISTTATADTFTRRLVWNAQNRVPRPVYVIDATASWTYTTATWRQANANTANQIDLVQGLSEDPVDLFLMARGGNSNASVVSFNLAIGEDSTTTPAANSLFVRGAASSASGFKYMAADFRKVPSVGYHYYAWLEYSEATGTTTWYSTTTVSQSGMTGLWMC